MKSRSFTKAKRIRCATRSLAALCRKAKAQRARTERRAVRSLLKGGTEEIPPVIRAESLGWVRVIG